MKVSELIEELKKMPCDAMVWHLWDGALRTEIEHVWLTPVGTVGTGDNDDVCYDTDDRPVGSPSESEDRYWKTPSQRDGDANAT